MAFLSTKTLNFLLNTASSMPLEHKQICTGDQIEDIPDQQVHDVGYRTWPTGVKATAVELVAADQIDRQGDREKNEQSA